MQGIDFAFSANKVALVTVDHMTKPSTDEGRKGSLDCLKLVLKTPRGWMQMYIMYTYKMEDHRHKRA